MKYILYFALIVCVWTSCSTYEESSNQIDETKSEYIQYESKDKLSGGIRMIPITTPKGEFKVWTKRVGNNPKKKVLLLHGGPGGTHEFFECFDGWLQEEEIEYYYYDQLGSYYSDQPSDTSLWTIERFVDEVEQVRIALGLDETNFYLYGQSWGGILAAEYALVHQDKMKGLIISNMVMDIDEYNAYAKEVLGLQMPEGVFEEVMAIEESGDFSNERYLELLFEHHYEKHIMRRPQAEWPEAVNRAFKHLNPEVYVYMQGQSEFGITPGATLEGWSVKDRLSELKVPTLSLGATHDSMDPKEMIYTGETVQNGRSYICPNGSHLSQYDDPKNFFPALIKFIHDVDAGRKM